MMQDCGVHIHMGFTVCIGADHYYGIIIMCIGFWYCTVEQW